MNRRDFMKTILGTAALAAISPAIAASKPQPKFDYAIEYQEAPGSSALPPEIRCEESLTLSSIMYKMTEIALRPYYKSGRADFVWTDEVVKGICKDIKAEFSEDVVDLCSGTNEPGFSDIGAVLTFAGFKCSVLITICQSQGETRVKASAVSAKSGKYLARETTNGPKMKAKLHDLYVGKVRELMEDRGMA